MFLVLITVLTLMMMGEKAVSLVTSVTRELRPFSLKTITGMLT
jgi:hypothetical protein